MGRVAGVVAAASPQGSAGPVVAKALLHAGGGGGARCIDRQSFARRAFASHCLIKLFVLWASP